ARKTRRAKLGNSIYSNKPYGLESVATSLQATRLVLASMDKFPGAAVTWNRKRPSGSRSTRLTRTGTLGGVTLAQLVPTRSSSHCMAAGREFAPEATFCRKLNRSIAEIGRASCRERG